MHSALLALTALALAVLPPAAQDDGVPPPDTHLPPEVGDVAPPLGDVTWFTIEEKGVYPDLAKLRGEVVVVHDWGYFCGSCVRVGVPMVVDLLKAQRAEGLRVLSLTCQVEDGQPDDHFVGVGQEMGIEHPMALASSFGEYSPYLNLNHQKNLTWCTVIGRHGAVVWKGDPSADGDEFLAAVSRAVAERDAPELGEPYAPELREALAELAAGDYAEARDTADKVARSHARKSGDEAAAVAADAERLVACLDAHLAGQEAALAAAVTAGDAEAFAGAARAIAARYPKSDAAKRVRDARKALKESPELEAGVEAWDAWLDLAEERPALFPARADKDEKRYAKALRGYLKKNEAGPGAATAERWLAAFDAL